jgi:small subunit ribosomal protein S18
VARSNDRDRKRTAKDTPQRGKQKVCVVCRDHVEWIDYKDGNLLRRFMSDRGKIRAGRVTGNCAQHQRDVAVAIKTAREVALLAYTQRTVSERGPGRGGGRSAALRDGQARPPDSDLSADGELDSDEPDDGEGPDELGLDRVEVEA